MTRDIHIIGPIICGRDSTHIDALHVSTRFLCLSHPLVVLLLLLRLHTLFRFPSQEELDQGLPFRLWTMSLICRISSNRRLDACSAATLSATLEIRRPKRLTTCFACCSSNERSSSSFAKSVLLLSFIVKRPGFQTAMPDWIAGTGRITIPGSLLRHCFVFSRNHLGFCHTKSRQIAITVTVQTGFVITFMFGVG